MCVANTFEMKAFRDDEGLQADVFKKIYPVELDARWLLLMCGKLAYDDVCYETL